MPETQGPPRRFDRYIYWGGITAVVILFLGVITIAAYSISDGPPTSAGEATVTPTLPPVSSQASTLTTNEIVMASLEGEPLLRIRQDGTWERYEAYSAESVSAAMCAAYERSKDFYESSDESRTTAIAVALLLKVIDGETASPLAECGL